MSTRPVPTNLSGWPGVTDLVITYKYILYVLWSSPSGLMSIIGVGRAGILEHICGATRLDEPVVLEALRELHRRGLVVLDEDTREVAVRRWCRFHKFGGKWIAPARSAFEKIESAVIRSVLVKQEGVNSIFPSKSKVEVPNTTTYATSTSPPPLTENSSEIENTVVVNDLIFTTQTPQAERDAIQAVLVSSGVSKSHWQAMLDELIGARLHRTISNPVGFLRGIAERAKKGTFTPERGLVVAQQRAAREAQANQEAAQKRAHPVPKPTSDEIDRLPAAQRRLVLAGLANRVTENKNQGAMP